jgi:hypothetical protein
VDHRPRSLLKTQWIGFSWEDKAMKDTQSISDPATWDPALDAVLAAPKHHKVLFENERLRVIEVTLEPKR